MSIEGKCGILKEKAGREAVDSPAAILNKRSDGMRYIISGKGISVTEGLKSAIYDKIGKLERDNSDEGKYSTGGADQRRHVCFH